MKFLLAIVLSLVSISSLFSQTDSVGKKKPDTSVQKPKPVVKPIERPTVPKDSNLTKTTFDSTAYKDSLLAVAIQDSTKQDSIRKVSVQKPVAAEVDTSTYTAIMYHGFIPFDKPFVSQLSQERDVDSNDGLFYLLAGVVALVAFVKISFPKYFQNLFSLFFQTSFRQKQTRDQLLQDNLASLLMNLLFIISGSIFVALLAYQQKWVNMNFWWILLYSAAILGAVYFIKYLFLLFSGWVFNVKEATSSYLFIVFLINKIMGIVLIPLLLIIAFSPMALVEVAVTVSMFVVGGMFLYRYVVSLGTIRTSLKVNALHFFLYLCAVEVLPLLLMYKVLFNLVRHYPNF